MCDWIDLERYPLDQSESDAWAKLVEGCRATLARDGLFNLAGFVRPEALEPAAGELKPVLESGSFTHARKHNIYFKREIEGLAEDHPALKEFETSNRTICADQMGRAAVIRLYEWPPFAKFLAAVMDKPVLYTMADPLARVNVMAYHEGQALKASRL